jgi:hypothetical protein
MSALPCPLAAPFAASDETYATITTFLCSEEARQVKLRHRGGDPYRVSSRRDAQSASARRYAEFAGREVLARGAAPSGHGSRAGRFDEGVNTLQALTGAHVPSGSSSNW